MTNTDERKKTLMKPLKIKTEIMGLDAARNFGAFIPRPLYVQVTIDEIGKTLSIEQYTIPLAPLGEMGLEIRVKGE